MKKNLLKNNYGLSLLELILTAMLAGVLIMFVSKVASTVMKGKIKSDESSAFIQVENAITQSIARRISTMAQDTVSPLRCNGGGATPLMNAGVASTPFTNNFGVQTLPAIGTLTATTAVVYPTKRQDILDAIGRCNLPKVPNTTADPKGELQEGAYYFCVQFSRGGSAASSQTSFFDAEAAFAEIRINLVDTSDALTVHTGPFKSCTYFRTTPSAGVVVYYNAYWRKAGDANDFTQSGKVLLPR